VIITHMQNADGQRRIYLGGKSSLEYCIEPKHNGTGWTFHWEPAVTGQAINTELARQSAIHVLTQLSEQLRVRPQELAAVPFDTIAALHATDPFSRRRISAGRRRTVEQGYMATAPELRRPQAEFTQGPGPSARRQYR
jgi:hypothetical protein